MPSSLEDYDTYIVAFSGGKDSIACFLHLLEEGIDPGKIELWHHEIDGREGGQFAMDWPYVPAYCREFGKAFGVPVYFSWKEGGFAREMLRDNQATAPTHFETPGGIESRGGNGPKGTRKKFPQVSGDLKVRWCSAYLKIDVMAAAIRAQPRFKESRTLVITGERAQESPGRAKYKCWEPDRSDRRSGALRRHVDHHRPIHRWTADQVWSIMKRWRVIPPPSYRLGWGRLSCMFCIFGNSNQWASARAVAPEAFSELERQEATTGQTIQRKKSITQLADSGVPYSGTTNKDLVSEVLDRDWKGSVLLKSGEDWILPEGAFSESTGPT